MFELFLFYFCIVVNFIKKIENIPKIDFYIFVKLFKMIKNVIHFNYNIVGYNATCTFDPTALNQVRFLDFVLKTLATSALENCFVY